MIRTRDLGLWVAATAIVGASGWLGCGGDDSSGATNADGGSSDSSVVDSGGGSDGGAGSDSSSADGGGVDTGTQLPVSCDNYCSLVMANCTMTNTEYSSKDICMAMCANMTLGARPDTSNDTVACRQDIAAAAQGNPSVACPQAGPTGGDKCGADHCTEWCKLDIARCGTIAYADQAACVTACDAFTYTKSLGDVALQSGNTMNCRIYHLEAAYANDGGLSSTHCPHTGSPSVAMGGGAGPCVN